MQAKAQPGVSPCPGRCVYVAEDINSFHEVMNAYTELAARPYQEASGA